MNDVDDVFTVDDYWDGPSEGVANFRGEPHVYERIFDNVGDDWTDRFRLTPIGGDVLESAIEAWGIWSRWFAAHKAGKTPAGTHPALPEEREHFFHLKSLVDNAVSKNESRSFVAYGDFSGGESGILAGDLQSLNVVWRLLDV